MKSFARFALLFLFCASMCGPRPFSKSDDFVGLVTSIAGEVISYQYLCPGGVLFQPGQPQADGNEPDSYQKGNWEFGATGLKFSFTEECNLCKTGACVGKPVCKPIKSEPYEISQNVIRQWIEHGSIKPVGERPNMEVAEGMLYMQEKFKQIPNWCRADFVPTTEADLSLSAE